MKTLNEMNKWNYKRAWEYFTENAFRKCIPEVSLYLKSLKLTETIDLRQNSQAKEIILSKISKNVLILIDGPSCNGKSTLAKRLANHVDAEIVDIDMICKSYIEEKLNSAKSPIEKILMIQKLDIESDIYLLNNLESIIKRKAKLNKPVILVGMYLEVVYRSIIAKVFGKYFDTTISLFCYENTFEDVKKLIKARIIEFKKELPLEYERCRNQYIYAKRLLVNGNSSYLGYGMSASFIVNTTVSNLLC